MRLKGLNILADQSLGRTLLFMLVLLILLIITLGFTYKHISDKDHQDKILLDKIGDQRVYSQTITRLISQAVVGQVGTFEELESVRNQFEEILNYQKGAIPNYVVEFSVLADLESLWNTYSQDVDTIIKGREQLSFLVEQVQAVVERIPPLLEATDEVVKAMAEHGVAADQVYIATRQLMLMQRISNNVSHILERGDASATAREFLETDVYEYGWVIDGMLRGNPQLNINEVKQPTAKAKLEEVSVLFNDLADQVNAMVSSSSEMLEIAAADDSISKSSGELLDQVENVSKAYQQYIQRQGARLVFFVLGIIVVVLMVLFGFLYWLYSKRQLSITDEQREQTEETNRRNQQAILRLLDEMGDLADGDLTVEATVTDDITGAISDSINYTITALRKLVTAINDTAQQVSSASQKTQATATHLAEASDHQAQQITAASTAINEMAISIEGVSNHAAELANEANRSVSIAHKGTDMVQATIQGMNTTRQQIQETAKRIKRLSESSQEIGEIVELISDIAEQTNTLALNAAIQAAMAGDAGRGFVVVADEVQRLAERSADATKQIEEIVKTIQADTNEAMASMEKSTSGVADGAQLTQDAGEALEEIETVSAHLADLIKNISGSAAQQAHAATNISDTMNVIQEITTQTSAGTNETSASIGNLAKLADELRHSVEGFKLPT